MEWEEMCFFLLGEGVGAERAFFIPPRFFGFEGFGGLGERLMGRRWKLDMYASVLCGNWHFAARAETVRESYLSSMIGYSRYLDITHDANLTPEVRGPSMGVARSSSSERSTSPCSCGMVRDNHVNILPCSERYDNACSPPYQNP